MESQLSSPVLCIVIAAVLVSLGFYLPTLTSPKNIETSPTSTSTKQTTMNNWKNYTKESDDVLRARLTPMQFNVTQKEGTERAFENEYYNNHEDGIYVDIVSGEPLFSSKDKYDSGTGWPSFTQTLPGNHVVEKKDKGLFTTRTEVRSVAADSHLGHVFPDGPAPTGMRFCMNSAALRFISKADLEKEGYGEYLTLFK